MSLRDDAVAIWKAGVAAVDSSLAVARQIHVGQDELQIADVRVPLSSARHIEIVGAGKAGAGMASSVEAALLSSEVADRVSGWVNVPADCVRTLNRIHLHAARPAGLNEPTQEAVDGTQEILRRVRSLSESDVCIVLLSGGASALLCSPVPEITLHEKQLLTRVLAGSGAPIHELNLVRTQLSQVKGGRLATACQAGTLVALIVSDVIGDPLDVIGSGPTTPGNSRAADALTVLASRGLLDTTPPRVVEFLEQQAYREKTVDHVLPLFSAHRLFNRIVASNAIAIEAATVKATALGYEVESLGSANAGEAADEGRKFMSRLRSLHTHSAASGLQSINNDRRRVCVLSGGEPTVDLSVGLHPGNTPAAHSETSARGGRNQELVLAAIARYRDSSDWRNIVLLSAGTDGEDGPTDAAGAIADESLAERIGRSGLDPNEYLGRHDSFTFLDAVDGLFRTGPTHTNVMDLRVGLRLL
ncbi:MAG: DUF4147 domain-containing protein [Planctomycetota bacterium]|nr:DUF4147 domain-containing protein [Planctomycetota bacterium]